MAEFLSNGIGSGDFSDFEHWFPWLVVVGAATFALTQVLLLTRCMDDAQMHSICRNIGWRYCVLGAGGAADALHEGIRGALRHLRLPERCAARGAFR